MVSTVSSALTTRLPRNKIDVIHNPLHGNDEPLGAQFVLVQDPIQCEGWTACIPEKMSP